MQITRGRKARAQKVVIYGPEGIGKSSFASQFPDPVFIDTEGSTDNMDVARLDKPTSWAMLKNEISFINSSRSIMYAHSTKKTGSKISAGAKVTPMYRKRSGAY